MASFADFGPFDVNHTSEQADGDPLVLSKDHIKHGPTRRNAATSCQDGEWTLFMRHLESRPTAFKPQFTADCAEIRGQFTAFIELDHGAVSQPDISSATHDGIVP